MNYTKIQESYRRMARAGLPFDPLTGADFKGANATRLQRAMQDSAWKDPRFISAEQAQSRGWNVAADAQGIEAVIRDASNGQSSTVTLFNAGNVAGMPGLEEMLAFGTEELQAMMGVAAKVAAQPAVQADAPEAPAPEVEQDDDLVIGPAAVALEKAPEAETLPAVAAAEVGQAAAKPAPAAALQRGAELSGELAAYAPYFLDRLHNFDGIEMVKQINRLIADQELAKNRKGIELLLSSYPNARRLGIEIAPMEKLRDDTLWKLNPSEPVSLLDGALARDKDGAYRPSAGGLVVIKDGGTSLVLKSKSEQAYRGAMELAKSKGWAAIELKGKPKMLAQAWIEAKLMGLEVVNYKPTEQDREQLAARIAAEEERQRGKEGKADKAANDAPEVVEVRPVTVGPGKEITATVAHTVSQAAPVEAGQGEAVASQVPVVARSVTRVGDVVRENVQEALVPVHVAPGASVAPNSDAAQEVGEAAAEQQVAQAADAAQREEGDKALESVVLLEHGVAPYDHNPRNKESYFAKVRDAAGVERTIWGVDLPRSIGEASAGIGDTIALRERGRQPVTVQAELPGGGVEAKTAHRVRWETTVLSKALAEEVKANVVQTGMHIGPVMKIEGGLIGQKNGRDPEVLAWHDATKLDGPVPAVGDWAEINYSNGRGAVHVRGNEIAAGIER